MDDLTWYVIASAFVAVPVMVGWTSMFPKAGWPWWSALVPFLNAYVLVLGVARLSWLWLILVFTPGVNVVAVLLVNVEVARRFGKSEAFGLGLTLLGFIFYPVLGFGPDPYQEGEAVIVGPE